MRSIVEYPNAWFGSVWIALVHGQIKDELDWIGLDSKYILISDYFQNLLLNVRSILVLVFCTHAQFQMKRSFKLNFGHWMIVASLR